MMSTKLPHLGESAVLHTSATLRWIALLARISLAAAFLSAVGDRFGIWSLVHSPGVDWGSMTGFYRAVAALNPWLPAAAVPALAWVVTAAELIVALWLLVGYGLKWASLASGFLLLAFALAMAAFLGSKLPLNYSVFTASACAFLLYAIEHQADLGRDPRPGMAEKDGPAAGLGD